MFKSGKLYKIITACNGCKGIESAIIEYLGDSTDIECRGLSNEDENTCIVRVVELNDAWGNVGWVWCINKDCEYKEVIEKLSWKNTFDCKKVFPKDFDSCIEIAESINYPFICFNGFIYRVSAHNWNCAIGMESEL